jgi:hypothetical protein
MATRQKSKKKSTRSKKSDGRKSATKQPAPKRKTAKKLAKKKASPKKAAGKKKALANATLGKTESGVDQKRRKSQPKGASGFSRESSGLESGDLQGLSNVESVDSESVEELLEEGNAFEAGVVSGVEDSGKREGKEVRTREVPEDDVPSEYLDKE